MDVIGLIELLGQERFRVWVIHELTSREGVHGNEAYLALAQRAHPLTEDGGVFAGHITCASDKALIDASNGVEPGIFRCFWQGIFQGDAPDDIRVIQIREKRVGHVGKSRMRSPCKGRHDLGR